MSFVCASMCLSIHPFGIDRVGSGCKLARLSAAAYELRKYEVVALQGVFNLRLANAVVVATDYQAFLENKLGHANFMTAPPCFPLLADAGLAVASKYPIISTAFHRFVHTSGADAIAAKGILYAQIRLDNGRLLHLFNAHVQSIGSHADLDVRDAQLVELVHFQTSCLKTSVRDDVVVVCGNFNLDAINEKKDAFRTPESLDYKKLAHLISCERTFVDPFRKYARVAQPQLSYQRAHPYTDVHPVTYSSLKGQRCVDYLFISAADVQFESLQSTLLPMDKVSPHRCLLLRITVPVPQPRFNLIRRPSFKPNFLMSCLGLVVAMPWISLQSFVWFLWRWRQLYNNMQ
jgi:endonuclease/exonuclease/phosphatase family metal-dependent hydrolase